MRKSHYVVGLMVLATVLMVSPAATAGGLEGFLDSIDVRAGADLGSFRADLRLTFGVSEGKIDGIFGVMSKPSDVYMCLRVGEVTGQPMARIITEYQRHRGQGWGVIAKGLGIKPGSAEFHALKANRLPTAGERGSSDRKGMRGKARGK
jgi:hypothetical protein